jgi:hypothetical protein
MTFPVFVFLASNAALQAPLEAVACKRLFGKEFT